MRAPTCNDLRLELKRARSTNINQQAYIREIGKSQGALTIAAGQGNLLVVRALLDAADQDGYPDTASAVFDAAGSSHWEIVEILLQAFTTREHFSEIMAKIHFRRKIARFVEEHEENGDKLSTELAIKR